MIIWWQIANWEQALGIYTFKWERLYYWRPQTVTEVKAMTKEYVKHYNYGRGHMRHEYLTPANVYFSETSLYINTDTNVA